MRRCVTTKGPEPGRERRSVEQTTAAGYLSHHLCQPRRLRHHHPAAPVLRGEVWRLAAGHRPAVRHLLAVSAGGVAGTRRLVGPLRPSSRFDLQLARHRCELRHAGHGPIDRAAVYRAHRLRTVRWEYFDGPSLRRRCDGTEGSRARLWIDRRGVWPWIHLRTRLERSARAYQLHRTDLDRGRADAGRDIHGLFLVAGNGASRG